MTFGGLPRRFGASFSASSFSMYARASRQAANKTRLLRMRWGWASFALSAAISSVIARPFLVVRDVLFCAHGARHTMPEKME